MYYLSNCWSVYYMCQSRPYLGLKSSSSERQHLYIVRFNYVQNIILQPYVHTRIRSICSKNAFWGHNNTWRKTDVPIFFRWTFSTGFFLYIMKNFQEFLLQFFCGISPLNAIYWVVWIDCTNFQMAQLWEKYFNYRYRFQ